MRILKFLTKIFRLFWPQANDIPTVHLFVDFKNIEGIGGFSDIIEGKDFMIEPGDTVIVGCSCPTIINLHGTGRKPINVVLATEIKGMFSITHSSHLIIRSSKKQHQISAFINDVNMGTFKYGNILCLH